MIDIVFVVLPGTLLLDLAGPAEAFRQANQQLARRGHTAAYRLRHVGPRAQAITSVGAVLAALEPLPDALPRDARVVLLGQPSGSESALQRPLSAAWNQTRRWLGRVVQPHIVDADVDADAATPTAGTAVRLMTVCAGALLAADAGLLAQRRCTTHHEMLDALTRLAPSAQVLANRLFVIDGAVASSAGITAGIDLALHLIASDIDDAIAAAVAQTLVVFQRRGPDDAQLSPLLRGRDHLHPAVHRVQNAVLELPASPWSLQTLAAVAHVTPRHLARLFHQHVGRTPREYVSDVRVAIAQRALDNGASVKQALPLAGFAGDRQWRRVRARAHT